MKRYFKYVKRYALFFILAPLFMLTEVVGEVWLPKLVSLMVNNGIANKNVEYIISMGLTMVGVALIMMMGGVLGGFFATKAAVSFAADLRSDVFKKIQSFSFKNIDNFSTGSLVTRLTNDITQMQNVIRMSLVMLLRSPGMLIGGLYMASTVNGSLAAVIAVVIPVLVISVFLILKTAFPRFDTMQVKLDNLNTRIQENITNMRVIKSFLRNDFEEEKFEKCAVDLKEATVNAMKIVILNMPVVTLLMNLTTIAVVWVGGNFIIKGDMQVGDLTAFTTYIIQILMSLMMLSMIFLQASRAIASAKRIGEIIETVPDLSDENAASKGKKVQSGSVEFKNVSFKYNLHNKEKILDNISFSIKSGETVGILGTTGSGKTSLVQLIPRLYDATEGEVLVDGTNVKDYLLSDLRNSVGIVLQKNVLFSGTIRENLLWGDDNATDEEIKEMAGYAYADRFVEGFTDGYETELGQGGVNLSGGQKQRLCIARALIKKPKILILDDSTSAVDATTDAGIRHALATTLKDTTKIIIAQRIQSVVNSDKIIVIEDGKIAGIGKHDELIENNEEYRSIYYSQVDKEAAK